MAKRRRGRAAIKRRNPVARDLGSRKYAQRVVPSKRRRVPKYPDDCECDARDRRACQQDCKPVERYYCGDHE